MSFECQNSHAYSIHKSCDSCCSTYRNEYFDFCTQELINFCWVLLTPDSLNRLKVLLQKEYGFSSEKADEYIERKQTVVLNDLRILDICGKGTPLGCKSDSPNMLATQIQEIFECCHVQENKLKSDQFRGLQVQSIFQKLVRDSQEESKRNIECSNRYERSNTQRGLDIDDAFVPWEVKKTQKIKEKEVNCGDPICTYIPESKLIRMSCMSCLRTLMLKHCNVSEVKTSHICDMGHSVDKNTTGDVNTEPQQQVVTDQSTDIIQTTPEPEKQVRNQLVQTELKGNDMSVQTELVHDEYDDAIDNEIANIINTSTDEFLTKKEKPAMKPNEQDDAIDNEIANIINTIIDDFLSKKEKTAMKPDEQDNAIDNEIANIINTSIDDFLSKKEKTAMKPDEQDESKSFLRDLMNTSIESSFETLQEQPKEKKVEFKRLVDEPEIDTMEQHYSYGKCTYSTVCEEDIFMSASSQQYFSPTDSLNDTLDSANKEALEDGEYFEADGIHNEQVEDPRTSIFITKRPSNLFDEADGSSYHTPSRDESPTEHVRFNLDFNSEELTSRIFHLDDDKMTFFTQSDTSSHNSQYDDALEKSNNDCGVEEVFQSVDQCNELSKTTQRQSNSYYMNRNMEIWYHGSVSRHEAENILRNSNEGSYLVRNSESHRSDYSLSLKSARGFMHMKIQQDPETGKFILGQFSSPFDNIPGMIKHFAENRLPILGAEHMCLLHPMIEQLL
ncbi:hypothetical protein WDU94_010597 [Cyamophila willieti]